MDGGLSKLRDAVFRRGWTLSFSPLPEGEGNCPFPVVWACPLGNLSISAPEGAGNRVIVDFPDLIRAEVSYLEKAVRVFPLVPDLPFNSLEHFVLDILFPRLIASSDTLVLHGALVAHGEDAICLIGESGRGKSTLSAALRGAGWTLHGDDALEVQVDSAGIAARATYPSLRLNPDSLEHLFPDPPADLPLVADYLDKFRLDPGEALATIGHCRLRAIFVLGEDDGSGDVTLRPLSASRLCMTLVGQSFALDPSDPKAAHRRLSAASAVAARVPGFMLGYPRDYVRLPEAIDHISATLDRVLELAADKVARKEST